MEKSKKPMEFLIAGGLLLFMLALQSANLFTLIEIPLLDLRYHLRGDREIKAPVVAIGIDEKSLDHPKSGPWPWPRSLHAQMLYDLGQIQPGPSAVGYNILFEGRRENDHPGDMDLVHRAEDLKNKVVLGYFFEKGFRSRYDRSQKQEKRLRQFALPDSDTAPEKLSEFDKVSLPFEELSEQALLGFVNMAPEKIGGTYKLKLLAKYHGRVYPSYELMLVLRHLDAGLRDVKLERRRIRIIKEGRELLSIPVTAEGDMWIFFYGKKLPLSYSFIEVIHRESFATPVQAREMLANLNGKVVLVGRSAFSLKESHVTPFDTSASALNLRVQAVANLLEKRLLTRAPAALQIGVTFAMTAAALFLFLNLPLRKMLAAGLLLAAVYFLMNHILFLRGYWLDLFVPLAAPVIVLLGLLMWRYFTALEELKRTQDQLIHSTKMAMVGNVSANMAHEFRNILHAIRLHVEGCMRPNIPEDRMKKYMTTIFKIMGNAEMILNGILSFSRKNKSEKVRANLKRTVEDTLLLIKKEMEYQNIQVQLQLENVADFEFDSGQISQVIMNLINNARDALKDQKEKIVLIRLREDGQNVYLDIADNGPGIPKEVMKHLFEAFVTTKEAGKGTGLGLSVCHGIIKNHGGTIQPKSVSGQGTVWQIVFPKSAAA